MHARSHRYRVTVVWTGDRGRGTADYRAYGRDHRIESPGKPPVEGYETPWHQDGHYWPIRPLATCTVWVALETSPINALTLRDASPTTTRERSACSLARWVNAAVSAAFSAYSPALPFGL